MTIIILTDVGLVSLAILFSPHTNLRILWICQSNMPWCDAYIANPFPTVCCMLPMVIRLNWQSLACHSAPLSTLSPNSPLFSLLLWPIGPSMIPQAISWPIGPSMIPHVISWPIGIASQFLG